MGCAWVYMQKVELRYRWECVDEKTGINSPPKRTFHAAAFSVLLIVFIFFNSIHPNFPFFFLIRPQKERMHDMLVLPCYSDVSNVNLGDVLE